MLQTNFPLLTVRQEGHLQQGSKEVCPLSAFVEYFFRNSFSDEIEKNMNIVGNEPSCKKLQAPTAAGAVKLLNKLLQSQ